ncbi:MAG TPA: hypothetical protein VFS33_02445 [Gemmatimonadales bacterium]|nr:hypothetical protein [Gemmatimonadales bacterium]
MERIVRRTGEMAVHARDFCREHPSADANFAPVVDQLDEQIVRMRTASEQQQDAHLVEHADAVRRGGLRLRLRDGLLHLVTVADLAERERPVVGERLRLPAPNATYEALLTRSRQLLTQARAEQELLVRHGLAEGVLDVIAATVAELEASLAASAEARRRHVAARTELREARREVLRLVAMLDGLNRYRFRDQPSLRAAWASARKVVGGSQASAPEAPAQGGEGVQPAA